MGKFERELKQRVKQAQPTFEEFAEKHNITVDSPQNGVAVKAVHPLEGKKRYFIIGAICLVLVVAILCAIFYRPQNNPTDLNFTTGNITNAPMTVEQCDFYMERAGTDIQLTNKENSIVKTKKPSVEVFATITGEIDVVDGDLYVVEMNFYIDARYPLFNQEKYEDMPYTKQIDEHTFYYGEPNTVENDGFNTYRIKSEYNGNTCYIKIQCLEQSIDQFLTLFCA